jgi:hypothetical protein
MNIFNNFEREEWRKGLGSGINKEWIKSILVNDEYSTDNELIDYFVQNGLDECTAQEIIKQRDRAICSLNFELDI